MAWPRTFMKEVIKELRELGLLNELGDRYVDGRPFPVTAEVEDAPLTGMLLDGHEGSEDVELDEMLHCLT